MPGARRTHPADPALPSEGLDESMRAMFAAVRRPGPFLTRRPQVVGGARFELHARPVYAKKQVRYQTAPTAPENPTRPRPKTPAPGLKKPLFAGRQGRDPEPIAGCCRQVADPIPKPIRQAAPVDLELDSVDAVGRPEICVLVPSGKRH